MTTQTNNLSRWPRLLVPGLHFWAALKVYLPLRIAFSVWAIIVFMILPANLPDPALEPLFWEVSPTDHVIAEKLLEPWFRWDAMIYMRIAAVGYDADPGFTAFPPLYPMLTRGLGQLLGGYFLLAGLLISNGALFVALMLLHRLVARDHGARLADRTLLYLAVFPASFAFLLPFTESLFLLLILASLSVAVYKEWAQWRRPWLRWALAALLGALAAVTRWQGAVLVLPLGWLFLEERRAGRSWSALFDWTFREWTRWLPALWFGLIPAALLGVFWWLEQSFGPGAMPLARYDTGWGAVWVWPWTTLTRVPLAFFNPPHPDLTVLGLVSNWLVAAFFLALLMAAFKRVRLAYVFYGWAIFLPAIMVLNFETALVSTIRYALAVFPAFMMLAFIGSRYKWLHNLLIFGGFALAMVYSFMYLQWMFIF